ncbi:MAG: hypothetical protein AAFV88_11745 [Planctomycetota bacterium]
MKRWFILAPLGAVAAIGLTWQLQSVSAQEKGQSNQQPETVRTQVYGFSGNANFDSPAEAYNAVAIPGGRAIATTPYWSNSAPATFFRSRTRTSEEDQKAIEIAKTYLREKNDEEKAALMEELKSAVATAFDQQMAMRQKEIDKLQAQLDEIKERMKNRKDLGEKIIERRVRELAKQPDQTDWYEGSARLPGLRTYTTDRFIEFPEIAAPRAPQPPVRFENQRRAKAPEPIN